MSRVFYWPLTTTKGRDLSAIININKYSSASRAGGQPYFNFKVFQELNYKIVTAVSTHQHIFVLIFICKFRIHNQKATASLHNEILLEVLLILLQIRCYLPPLYLIECLGLKGETSFTTFTLLYFNGLGGSYVILRKCNLMNIILPLRIHDLNDQA